MGQTADKELIEKIIDLSKRSLCFLCKEMLHYDDWDLVHDDIERMLLRPSRRKMILIPRGHLKTAIITKAFTIQQLLKNPNLRILIANQVWDKAREMLAEIKEYLDTKSDLPKLFGSFKSDRWNQDEIVIRQRTRAFSAPSVGTTGVEAEMTSTHYDIIILDDLQGLQNSQTPEQRAKVKKFYQSMLDLLEPGGLMIVVGTRWHLDDIYQHILDNEAKYFDIAVRKVIENGKLIFPNKFNLRFDEQRKSWSKAKAGETCLDYINHLKKTKGAEFYSQYMNDPVDEENQLFKKSYFKPWIAKPEKLHIVLTIDPAISEKQEADNTAMVVAGMDDKYNIYVLDRVKGRFAPKELINQVFILQERWNPTTVGIETIGFQKTLMLGIEDEMRERKRYFPVTEIKTGNQISKEYRIKSLEPFYRRGAVFHAPFLGDLEQELMAFPRAKHDDLADALSMALPLLSPGDKPREPDPGPGTFEFVANEARRYYSKHDRFFNI